MKRITTCFLAILCWCIVTSASPTVAADYKLSMLPRYSTEEINARIIPLAKYLSDQTGLVIVPTLTSTFDQYIKQLSSGTIDIGFQNPYIYVLASKAHEVVAMAIKGTNRDKFRGFIITSSSSPLHTLEDLRGKKISIVGYTSAGGYLSQKLTMLDHGIDVDKECILEEAPENKQENVIFSVYTGDVDAGFVRESALNKAQAFVPASALTVMEGTAWLPNWAISVSRDMPQEDKAKIAQAIQALQDGAPALKALKVNKFRVAHDSEYNIVRRAAELDGFTSE